MLVKPRIGLLGGSFNPAHDGHVHLSLEAARRLQLDEVWWLVSPANPLKDAASLEEYATRLAYARNLTQPHRFIRVMDAEAQLGMRYSIEIIRYFQQHYPKVAFTWLMGADNLVSFHRWLKWREIVQCVPVVVFNRSPFAHAALRSRAALYARSIRRPIQFIFMRLHPLSATDLRKKLGKNAFLWHNDKGTK